MPTLTRDDVQRLARLARLRLTEQESAVFARQLADILEFVRQVQAVDTSSVEAAGLLRDPVDALRDDVVRPSLDRDQVLSQAPGADRRAGLFKVPRVFNG